MLHKLKISTENLENKQTSQPIEHSLVEESDYELGIKALKNFALILKKRMENDWDNVVAITGEEGSGKSTAAIVLGKLVDKRFKISRNEIVGINNMQLIKKITMLPPKSVIIVDEAIKLLYKHDWASKSQKLLNTIYALARKERKTTILCIPRFKDLNEFFRNHRVKFWIHLLTRGLGVLFARDWSPFNDDPWWLKDCQKVVEANIKGKKLLDVHLELKLHILKRCKNYVSPIIFPDLDEKTKQEYRELIDQYKYEGLFEEKETKSKREQKLKEKIKRAILHLFFEKKYPRRKIVEILKTSKSFVEETIKEDPRYEEMKKQKQKQQQVQEKTSFLDILRNRGLVR